MNISDDAMLLVKAARAWNALRSHAGAVEGSPESRQIARDVMSILTARAGIVRASECGNRTIWDSRNEISITSQVSGGGSGI